MNIFVTDPSPYKSAIALDDLRLNKMILESAQMLCTAYPVHYPVTNQIAKILYKPAYEMHPCTRWVKANKFNFLWLGLHFDALGNEKFRRTKVKHKSHNLFKDIFWAPSVTGNFLYDEIIKETVFNFNCSDTFPRRENVFEDYKECLRNKWKRDEAKMDRWRRPKWTKCNPPEWK